MEHEHSENAGADIAAIAVRTFPDNQEDFHENHEINGEDNHAADKAEFLRQNAENKIRALLRKKTVMALRAHEVALPSDSAGTNRDQRLYDVPAGPQAVSLRVHENNQTLNLVVFEQFSKKQRENQRERDYGREVGNPEDVVRKIEISAQDNPDERNHDDGHNQDDSEPHIREDADYGKRAGRNLRVPHRKDCEHNRQKPEKQQIHDVAQRNSRNEAHHEENRKINAGRTQIRLDEDEAHRGNQNRGRNDESAQRTLVHGLVKVSGKKEHEKNLSEFGGLHAEFPDSNPAFGSVHVTPENPRVNQQENQGDVKIW